VKKQYNFTQKRIIAQKAESGNIKMIVAIVSDRRMEVINVPKRDGTGPKGQGPRDGHGKGKGSGQGPMTGGKKGTKEESKK
jgi:hypothetical protein